MVTSPALARAVLTEMSVLARRLAPLGARLALGPGSHGSREERQKLNAVPAALDRGLIYNRRGTAEPVPGSDLELLHAIPPRMPPPRRLPAPAETVAGLCTGVINSAERVRHLAWETSNRPASSADLTINSLRQVAATSTLTSHHCEILLRALAERETAHRPGGEAAGLLQAADAAGRTRQRWLDVAHTLDRVTSTSQPTPPNQLTWPCGPGGSPTPTPNGPWPADPATRHGPPKNWCPGQVTPGSWWPLCTMRARR